MYFLYALLAVLAYSMQNALMAPLYRQINDKLAIVFIRGICISLSFSPVLLLVPDEAFVNVLPFLPDIIFASSLAVVGTWAAINAVDYLAVGIANTLLSALSSLFIVIVSVLFLGEDLSFFQHALIFMILLSVLALGFSPASGKLPARFNPNKGLIYCIVFAAFTGSAFILLGLKSRSSNPLLVGYLWESLIGVLGALLIGGRRIFSPNLAATKERISSELLLKIFFCSAPAGLGSGLYALAMSQGSIAITSAILSLCMVVTTLLTVTFFGEKLSAVQWKLLILICFFVAALKLAI